MELEWDCPLRMRLSRRTVDRGALRASGGAAASFLSLYRSTSTGAMSQVRHTKILSVVLLVMLPASVVRAQEELTKPLTLEEAVSLALSHNRELKQAGLEIHKQQE